MGRNFVFYIAASFFIFTIIPLAKAEILLGQNDFLYNLGDEYIVNVSLIPAVVTDDFMTAELVCPNGDVEIYRSFYSLKANEQENIELPILLGKSLLGDLEGNCYLNVEFGNDEVKSREFVITNDIEVSLNIVGASFDPGKEVFVKGNAKKKNGLLLNGFVEASIDGLNRSIFASSKEGNFNFSFSLSSSLKAGNYELKVRVYEKDSAGGIANEGFASSIIKISQIIEKIEIAIDSQNIIPGNSLVYRILLYDQAGLQTKDDVSVIFYLPDESVFSKKLVKAGESIQIPLALNASPGYWLIESKWRELSAKRTFFVVEVENVSMKIENQTLVITNIGNVPYRKTLEFSIGEENELKEIKLDIGETKRYKMSAKDGEYEIKISDGYIEKNFGRNYLTGSAVDIREESSAGSGSARFAIWIIILLILAIFAFKLYRKVKKKDYFAKKPSFSFGKEKMTHEVSKELTESHISGKKEGVAILVLKIKNLSELLTSENNALPAIERTIQKAKDAKARVYEQGEYKTMILSPSFLGETDVVGKTLVLAEEIRSIIDEYNKYYALKINYGIGVHSGEMILETSRDGKVRFTAVGGTTVLPKRAADRANEQVYLTEIIHRKMLGKIKSDKISNEGFWKLNQVVRRDEHKEFINKFMKKQSDERARKAGFTK